VLTKNNRLEFAMNNISPNDASSKSGLRLTYIIGTYPGLTTTFIDREIRMLRRWGVDLQVLAIRRPRSDTPLSRDQRDLQQGVLYLLPVAWLQLFLSHLYFVVLHPLTYLGTLLFLVTRSYPDQRTRAKSLLHFGEGIYAAYLLRKRPFQELHAHFVDRAATVAMVAGRLLGKPYSISIHAGPDIFVTPVLLREKVAEARHVVTCTLYNKARVEDVAGHDLSSKITYVHHGLELKDYDATPAAPRGGPPRILSVGQLTPRKGFVRLIQACRRLKDQGYAFSCHIVGRGPQYDELQDLIRRLQLHETVVLHGALPHEAVIEHYRQASIFVLACQRSPDGDMDGFPNVLAEAMAMEVPVISTAISAIPELLEDGQNGLMVPADDEDALVSAMARLLDDPSFRASLARQGKASVIERFDVEHNVRRFASTLWPEWFPSLSGEYNGSDLRLPTTTPVLVPQHDL
jgi:glycosyltransferase involved in cell wall biosynthesis